MSSRLTTNILGTAFFFAASFFTTSNIEAGPAVSTLKPALEAKSFHVPKTSSSTLGKHCTPTSSAKATVYDREWYEKVFKNAKVLTAREVQSMRKTLEEAEYGY